MSNETHQTAPDVEVADLATFDDGFVASELQEDFQDVPDGKYRVNIERVELIRAQTSGAPMIKWTLRVLGPQHRGRLIWRNSVISEKSLPYLKTDLHKCGLELAKLSELPQHLDRLLDVKLAVTVRTKGEYQSVYFDKRVEAEEAEGDFQERTDEALKPF